MKWQGMVVLSMQTLYDKEIVAIVHRDLIDSAKKSGVTPTTIIEDQKYIEATVKVVFDNITAPMQLAASIIMEDNIKKLVDPVIEKNTQYGTSRAIIREIIIKERTQEQS